ncbi:MAG TPA: helix-turn-helix domain-containing protein [Actinomycetaceae bacterium]|nr:helix-turn-helix domain-containing protein [Actinomycetaceae bacterium]
MGSEVGRQETFEPAAADEVAKVYDFISAHEQKRGTRPAAQYFLSGADVGDQVELPPEMYEVLTKVVSAMHQGLAVTIAPLSKKLTTQQAADLLGISRVTLVKLLNEGRLPYERIRSHRRLLLRDVLDYRETRRREQYDAIEAMSVEIEDEGELEVVLESLKETRRAVAERRRRRDG